MRPPSPTTALSRPATCHPAGVVYPEEVSALVLEELLAAAQQFSGRPVTKAVISVPAYFTDAQRAATIAAGRLAGLESIRIIREPVAAAMAYGLDVQVCAWGGWGRGRWGGGMLGPYNL